MIMNGLSKGAIARRFKSWIAMVFAGMLLVLNVACSSSDAPMASDTSSSEGPAASTKTLYEPVQPKKDGMNRYDDDVRNASPEVKAKSRALIDNAKQNIKKSEDPEDIPEKVLESADNLKDEISEEVQERTDNFAKGTKKGMRNLKGNLERGSREIPEVFKEGTENAKNSVKKSADSVKDTVDTLKQNIDETM